MEKIFIKLCAIVMIVLAEIFIAPALISEASTLLNIGGVIFIMAGIYAVIKIIISFFKEKN